MSDNRLALLTRQIYKNELNIVSQRFGTGNRNFFYRKANPGENNAIKSFLDKCGQSEEFQLVVKRTRIRTPQEAME